VVEAKEHQPTLHGLTGDRCGICREKWPCLVERLRLEVERLRGLIVAWSEERAGDPDSLLAEARTIREADRG